MNLTTAGWCGLIVNAESAGVQSTTVASAVTKYLRHAPTGFQTNLPFAFGVVDGVYNQLYIYTPDSYGGAFGTQYPVAATVPIRVPTFGMFRPAGDASNLLTFYSKSTQIASYSRTVAIGLLISALREIRTIVLTRQNPSPT